MLGVQHMPSRWMSCASSIPSLRCCVASRLFAEIVPHRTCCITMILSRHVASSVGGQAPRASGRTGVVVRRAA
ncbi:hypothetical protein HAX54_031490, partial [Datura stramonium]|nr:hypothetical protein [Datura stramonium]